MTRYYLALICLSLLNCKPESLSIEELQAYIMNKENCLKQTCEVNGTTVSVTFRPTDIWVHQELDRLEVDRPTLDSLRSKYADYYYFVLSISRDEEEALHVLNSKNSYSQLVETLSFRMPQYVTLTTASQDTIPVGDFVLNRTYGLGSATDILFAFNKEKVKDSDWVQFNMNEFGMALGNRRFKFSRHHLDDVPEIKFSVAN